MEKKNYGTRRYRTKKLPFLLPQVQTGNNYQGAANEYIRYQRARHTDTETITNEDKTCGCITYYFQRSDS